MIAANTKKPDTAAYAVRNPTSIVAEAVRALRQKKPKVVTVTSSFPGEGKTTLSLWMARLAAKSGERVILVDTDLRRPNVHKSIGQSNEHSIVEYLTDKKPLEQIIHKDKLSGADMIYARSVPASALDLVGSAKMDALIERLREDYDLVILDTPACLAVSDARLMASISDQTLYAVSWNTTPREAVAAGVKQFTDMRYEPLAFVLTNVDVKKHVRYGYGDTVYYYGRYEDKHSK